MKETEGGGGGPSHHLCSTVHISSSLLILYYLFEKLYKYAEQPDDKIPISGIAR